MSNSEKVHLNIHQKINEIQKNITTVFKGSTVRINQNASYKAVSHDDVAALLHLPLAEAGIHVIVSMDDCKIESSKSIKEDQYGKKESISYMAIVQMRIIFVNSDNPQDFFETKQTAYALDSGDKAVGKAQSMAVKYAYLKNFNLESTDDEESRDFEHHNTVSNKVTEGLVKSSQVYPPQSAIEMASDAQMRLLEKLYPGEYVDRITKKEAGEIITDYNKKSGYKPSSKDLDNFKKVSVKERKDYTK